ncbi:uncharacterized protein VICG_00952 [Vittaforma corneae ATCC 50505]|uniref:Uncharacterized protein n=1 Tax=Vittaforma corneae (strain ATCC 50505) TaxID=993615 RepID=L2GN57_VITCO|nr:uncharacterized protein VICG_00952 [Vittaforma corneae ATCC 50505]ELA41935.1 hypothetical protein VICG_00952 [Vittaforma corneae ATCC 50505]
MSGSVLNSNTQNTSAQANAQNSIMSKLNSVLSLPTQENIFSIFDIDGYIRLNMLYINPVSLKHLKAKLDELGMASWMLAENELIFRLEQGIVSFRGILTITFKESKIFSLELDFDPVISSPRCGEFLREIEVFLKQCDACFFMAYFTSVDSEILGHPLSESIGFLASRK